MTKRKYPHFLIFADLSNEVVSNGKSSLLRLGRQIQNRGYRVSVVFFVANQPPYFVDVKKHFGTGFKSFKQNFPSDDDYANSRRHSRVRYAESEARLHDLEVLDSVSSLSNDFVMPIYPETLPANPLNADKIVRYYGNKPDMFLKDGDVKYQFGEREFKLAASRNIMPDSDFVLFDPHIDEMFMRHDPRANDIRNLNLTYMGKSQVLGGYYEVQNTIEIDRVWPDRFKLFQLLTKCNAFFTHDAYTMLNVEAVLCGAVPIYLNYGPWTDEEIDSGEFGEVPRLKAEQIDDLSKFRESFDLKRLALKQKIEHLQLQWPSNVDKFLTTVIQHFDR